MQLLYGAVFYEGIGYTDTSDTGNIVIVRHELQYGTAHSSFFDAVFYGDDMLEVESHLVQQGFVAPPRPCEGCDGLFKSRLGPSARRRWTTPPSPPARARSGR